MIYALYLKAMPVSIFKGKLLDFKNSLFLDDLRFAKRFSEDLTHMCSDFDKIKINTIIVVSKM